MNPDPKALFDFTTIIVLLVSLVTNLVIIRGATRSQKREVSFADEFARNKDHVELKGRVDKISDDIAHGFERLDQKRSSSIAGVHDDLEHAITELRKDVKQDVEGVHDRINVVLAAVSELKGEMKATLSK